MVSLVFCCVWAAAAFDVVLVAVFELLFPAVPPFLPPPVGADAPELPPEGGVGGGEGGGVERAPGVGPLDGLLAEADLLPAEWDTVFATVEPTLLTTA